MEDIQNEELLGNRQGSCDVPMTDKISSQPGGPAISLTPEGDNQTTIKMSTRRIMKNVAVASVGFVLLFTSFMALSNLQSSINKDHSLGTNGLATLYVAMVFSCMFLPSIIIGRFGCKWTIAFSMLCYILYMVANFYPTYATIIPAAIILGLGAGPLWSAQCTYLTETGVCYAKQSGQTEDSIISRFFGYLYMAFSTVQLWGNLISSLGFKETESNTITEDDLLTCGADFCPGSIDNNTNLVNPDKKKIYTVYGIYVGLAVLAFLVIAFLLDPITLAREEDKVKDGRTFSAHLVLATLKHLWRSKYQKLLAPMSIYSGIDMAFMIGAFNQSFVACALGIENIGFVMMCYGLVNSLCSLTFGRLVQYVGHIPFFILAFLLHGSLLVTFLMWHPDPDRVYMFYIFAGLWGMGDAVIMSQLNAIYGFLWTNNSDAAFANHRLWESLGFIIAFASQGYICTNVKIYITMCFLCAGMFGYATVEVLYGRENARRTKPIHPIQCLT